MAKSKVVVTGIDKLDRKFKLLDARVGKKVVRQAMRQALKPVLAAARANAPEESGVLRRSIKIRAVKRRKKGVIGLEIRTDAKTMGGDAFYAAFIELGTSDKPAQPFLSPAYVEQGPEAVKQLEQLILEGLEREIRALGKD